MDVDRGRHREVVELSGDPTDDDVSHVMAIQNSHDHADIEVRHWCDAGRAVLARVRAAAGASRGQLSLGGGECGGV